MLRRPVFILLLSVLLGWGVLLALTYLLEPPILSCTAPLVGAHWVATAKLSLDCFMLAGTGWVIGRLHRSAPLLGALAFAATLAVHNVDPLLNLDMPSLLRLAVHAGEPGYLGPLSTTAVQYLLLFGSLLVGALLSRPAPVPLTLFRENPTDDGRVLLRRHQ
jgi:hypothetical protein